MNISEKVVDFSNYCKRCSFFHKKCWEDPCNYCLSNPVNKNSRKPVNFKEDISKMEG